MRAAGLLIALLLAACRAEPSFDERYDKAEKQIRAKAAAIDQDLARPAASPHSAPSSE